MYGSQAPPSKPVFTYLPPVRRPVSTQTVKVILNTARIGVGDDSTSVLLKWNEVFLLNSPTSIQPGVDHIVMTDSLEVFFLCYHYLVWFFFYLFISLVICFQNFVCVSN